MSRVDQALARAGRTLGDDGHVATADVALDLNAIEVEAAPPEFRAEFEDTHTEHTAAPKLGDSVSLPHGAGFDGRGEADVPPSLLERIDSGLSEKVVVGAMMVESVEQYRRLAATLHHAQGSRGLKIVMIASAMSSEGKSLTAANLAMTLSESYRRRVLLVDADLRRPSLHRLFQLANLTGLSDGLRAAGTSTLPVTQLTEGLAVLTAGQPDADPMGSLTSDRMRQVLQEASESYDWVVLDTPPVALMPDANLLAAMVEGAVLVVRAGVTPYQLVQRAIEAIGRDRIVGVVLNGADRRLAQDYYYSPYAGRISDRPLP
jgi:capsular exopolysaccharide synthesis family protein